MMMTIRGAHPPPAHARMHKLAIFIAMPKVL